MTPSKQQAIQTALLGDWQEASSLNKALLNEDPNDIDALNRLAFAFTALGKIKEAKSTYRKVLQIDTLNPIALRNMKRLVELGTANAPKKDASIILSRNHTFLEESGKTKTIELINVAQPKVISWLRTGQAVIISIKRSKIFVEDESNQYVGALPDDIGKRLTTFIKGGNIYEAYVKSSSDHHVIIFIKELKRASRFKNYPSFSQVANSDLALSKTKTKNKTEKTEEDYLSDGEES